jgi:hypothetical protein
VLFGLILSALFALLVFTLGGTAVGPAVDSAFTSLGALAMKPYGYSAFPWFKEFIHGNGPGAAYIQMFVLSGFLWATVFAVLFAFTCWWWRRRDLTRQCS